MESRFSRREWIKSSTAAAISLAVPGLSCRPKKNIHELSAETGKSGTLISLKSNESSYGISDRTREAIIASLDRSHRYPHDSYPELTDLITEKENLPADAVMIGAGSTEIMVMLIQALRTPGEIVLADPTYFDFLFYARQSRRGMHPVRLSEDYRHDLSAIQRQITPSSGFVYICNPNNPTGTVVEGKDLTSFCLDTSGKIPVVVDEAYHEYTDDPAYLSMAPLCGLKKNIIVTRTFSKIFGLAGLRIGYALAHPDTIRELKIFQRNFAPVAYSSLKAAQAALRDEGFITQVKTKNTAAKLEIYRNLDDLKIFYLPSQANFVLFETDLPSEEAESVWEKQGILIRPFNFYRKNWIRVSMGTPEEMKVFNSVLHRLSRP